MDQIQLNDGDVVSMHPDKTFADAPMAVAKEVIQAMPHNHSDKELNKWVNEGVSCKVLQESGGGWQKGKIKLALIFIPDSEQVNQSRSSRLP